jgi:hypothetical protein
MCSTKANQENSPFLRLPAELRNQIYPYVCDTMTVDAPEEYEYVRSGFNMRLVCRQMNDEVTNIVEQYFVVQFSDKIDHLKVFNGLPRSEAVLEMELHQGLLEHVVEVWGIDCEACGPLEIKKFPNLRRVKVHNWVQCADGVEDRDVLKDVFCNENLDVVFN